MAKDCLYDFDCGPASDHGMDAPHKREMRPPLAFSKIGKQGTCVGDKCVVTNCGNCGEKAENGICCKTKTITDGICKCPCRFGYDCALNAYCVNQFCVTEMAGKTCGACGEKLVNDRCCAEGINKDGLCYCGTSKKCESWNHCSGNSVCCSNNQCYPRGTYPCPSGTHEI